MSPFKRNAIDIILIGFVDASVVNSIGSQPLSVHIISCLATLNIKLIDGPHRSISLHLNV